MTLTATAALSTRKLNIKSLGTQNPVIVYVPPIKNNIIICVSDQLKEGIQTAFQPIAARLIRE